jgi:Family of unknown function (DUF6228)
MESSPVVFASRTGCRLELTLSPSPHTGLREWLVRATGEGLDARVTADEAGWFPEFLDSFLTRLAGAPTSDEESWYSASSELRLTVSQPKENTVVVVATLSFEGPPLWTAEVVIELDPGAFDQAAAEARREAVRLPLTK